MIKECSLLATHLRVKVMFDDVYGKIRFISLLGRDLRLKVMFDSVYREIAFSCV